MIPIHSPNTPSVEPLLAGGFLFRPFVEDDAAAFTEAVRESRATVGQWMPWAHEAYSITDALAWFKHCEEQRAQGSSHEIGIFDATTLNDIALPPQPERTGHRLRHR